MKFDNQSKLITLLCVILSCAYSITLCNTQIDSTNISMGVKAPIIVGYDTLFFLHANIGPFSAQERASAISAKLENVIRVENEKQDSLSIQETSGMTNILLDTMVLMSLTDADLHLAGQSRQELVRSLIQLIQPKLTVVKKQYSHTALLSDLTYALIALFVCIVLFWLMAKLFPRLYSALDRFAVVIGRPIRSITFHLITPEFVSDVIVILGKGLRLVLSFSLLYYWITYTLSLFPWTNHWNVEPILKGIMLSALLTIAFIVVMKGIQRVSRSLVTRIPQWKGTLVKPVTLKNISLLTEDRIVEILLLANRTLTFIGFVIVGYFYVTILFNLFEFTETWASALFHFIANPLFSALEAFIGYLPNLFAILVIIGITRYFAKFVHFIFGEIGKGTITFPRFHRDWAEPTYKITRFLIFIFATIVIFPYLPGSNSPVFQGISVFVGVLFSLGSTSAIANIVAGIVLTYMRPFKLGDRVKIADTMGDVIEKTLLVTRVRSIKNVDISIPNSMVLSSHIINFSSSAQDSGLILHTSVTIGYDAPWKQVHALLNAAADATENILKDPKPFVFQTSLDDFYVSYELNAYTDAPNAMAKIYSELHQNIQDKFNEAGVEIMSPHYAAVRDGNQTAIPETYLPKTYQAPAFRVNTKISKPE